MAIEHSVITDPDVHEPKGIVAAAAGTVYVANGAGTGSWTASVNVDAASDNIPYVRLNSTWQPAAVNPVDSYWVADTTGIAAPPAGGDLLWNNVTQASATHIFVSAENTVGVTKRPEMLNYIQSYDTMTIYAAGDPNTFQRWKIVSAADGTSYIDYTVELIASNGGNIADNTDLILTFQANLVDAQLSSFLVELGSATAGETFVSDGAGSGSFAWPLLDGQAGANADDVPLSDGGGGVTWNKPYILRDGWRDMIMPFFSATAGPALSAPGWVKVRDNGAGSTGIYQRGFDDTTEEELFVTFHVDHDYKVGTAWYPHIHWMPLSSGTGVVRWGLEWTFAIRDDVTPAVFGTTTFAYLEQAACGTPYSHQIIEVADPGITLPNCEPDTLIQVRIFRDATHVNDTYVGDAIGLFLDAHYQIDRKATPNKAPDFYA